MIKDELKILHNANLICYKNFQGLIILELAEIINVRT
jgi:hypothetical protein